MSCFCGKQIEYTQCCGQYISEKIPAPSPEALMRSRYSAYCQGNIDYIIATMRGPALQGFDKQEAKAWADSATWLSLQVCGASEQGAKGTVEFIARYAIGQQPHIIHEVSEFERIDNRWYYTQGKHVITKSNAPCPCGSGKKFKRCCMAT